ncbi:MEDS domain-containing protein [Saccharothrix xinjiangensis]|uniref:MEDS domain-containing protein n=1 Tax=Saccharothrix xinjiangensis TaxID=204798 RepID=A0ABV9YB99_9PSEU
MRTSGVLHATRGLGLHDHICWPYDDPAEFRRRAVEFLADGLALGQRCWYVSEGPTEELLSHVAELGAALDSGALRVVSIDDTYGDGGAVTPAEQVATYAAATRAALADGFSGLRVAAEATPMVRGDEALDAFCRYEHLVDRYMAGEPFAAMCAYDRTELPASAIGQLACLHPASGTGGSPFRLYAVPHARVALDGELDLESRDDFTRALDRADLRAGGGPVVVDGSSLEFIDHHALFALSRAADGDVVLRTRRSAPARLAALVGVPGLRVEAE